MSSVEPDLGNALGVVGKKNFFVHFKYSQRYWRVELMLLSSLRFFWLQETSSAIFSRLLFREAQNSIRLGELGEAKKNRQLSEQFELLNEAFK